jgi:PhoPQ-activated pathogenicity-related protein
MRQILVALVGLLIALPARAGLIEYVQKPDSAFAWSIKESKQLPQGTVTEIRLVSQVWQGIKWEHGLVVYEPAGGSRAATMLLFNTGGNPNPTNHLLGLEIAKRVGHPIAFLFNIPNQPLFNGKKEDALIAETFVRFLADGGKDESWPLLFPMVKSLVKAMDALQAFAKDQWKMEVKDFVVSGASKRGWTTWLTAAAEPRVKAIAPMVIDVLNMQPQMKHQLESFGAYSQMIHDYTERQLLPMPDSDAARRLWQIVDPYFYRDRLTMPKMIINGANDPYWTVDALNLYWSDLKGDKKVLIVPNAGHGLRQKVNGKEELIPLRAVNTLAIFTKHQIEGKEMPQLSWTHDDNGGKMRLAITPNRSPKAARLWVADANSRDFRPSVWKEIIAASGPNQMVVGLADRPGSGYRAMFGELEYEIDGHVYYLSTQIRVTGGK